MRATVSNQLFYLHHRRRRIESNFMRPKFVFFLLLSVFLAVVAAVLLKQYLIPVSPKPVAAAPPAVAPAVAPTVAPAPAQPVVMAAPMVIKSLTPEEQEAANKSETDRLYDWSMNNDPQSLSNILNDLNSPEKEVRLAAIEATKQFGDTNAIPVLKAAAASSDDTQEQIAMLEAADFISLPDAELGQAGGSQATLTPAQAAARAQSQANSAARRQAYLAKHHPDQLPQTAPPANAPAGN